MKEMKLRKMKVFKKILLSGDGYIRISEHADLRMKKRGYSRADIVSCIMNGIINDVQLHSNTQQDKPSFAYVITGRDRSNNPVVVVLGEEGEKQYTVVTIMPPVDKKRFKDCIG